jgi:CheY-like chemotaxis protein
VSDLLADDEAQSEARRRILVVDDEPDVRRVIRRLLDEDGYRVHEAGDGAQALEFVRSARGLLDLVVSDIAMPRLNGVQLLEALATEMPELPCLLISGYAAPELQRIGIPAPCGVLAKPLQVDAFLAEVRRCLRQRN